MVEPLVSIDVPTCCSAAFLAAAIDSVLRQSHRTFEARVINDNLIDENSSDSIEEVMAKYTGPRAIA